ncbi:MAG: RNA 3'-terminal phosphate cyclase [Deltaproteobacteria bacterium]|nr:RNA 3'-terminal phosphate cyclase [Deltaproteobacteria bacterium]
MLTIDGSQGEGGGQILRSALSLSLVTGTPFRIERIRARRPKPGLLRQHLTAVAAAAELAAANVEGARLGSQTLSFAPGPVAPGDYRFAVGSAGSATLVLQTVLPPLLVAAAPSALTLEGGTHNPLAPPFEFLERAFLPLLGRLGPRVELGLERPGFYPAGGGRLRATIEPCRHLGRLELLARGDVLSLSATAVVSRLPEHIARRELDVLRGELDLPPERLHLENVPDPLGPGNVVRVEVSSRNVTEVFAAFGERGVPAETVALGLAEEVKRYLASGVPVGPYLADQLLLPLALGEGGRFVTAAPTAHAVTNAEILKLFLHVSVFFEELGRGAWRVAIETDRARAPQGPRKGAA